jgi:sterol desaturase/sphingolipid hydroxylase (fatty acid hydroxylase superfamily)
MEMWLSDRARLAALLAVCALLASLEVVVPLFRYRRGRWRRTIPNLVLAAGVVLINLALASMAAFASVSFRHWGMASWVRMRANPWLFLLLGVAGLDLSAYIAHVLLHKLPFGWRFHRVHHSELEVDVTTAFRQHPGETLWRFVWQCIGIAVLGLPFWILPVYLTLSSLNALLEHANIRLSDGLDKLLRFLIVTPNMHKIHHSRLQAQTDSNYSNIFSAWDRLFGTYTAQTEFRHLRYGLAGFDDIARQRLRSLIAEPFHSS